ncbi:MAG: FtsX-like permease family protein [Balneolaceae bacterium]|nr:FtsX-like permease family protein [Balneolaceae bacterium]
MENTGFIARRYLFSRKHVSLISTLTIISITGVTIGTALLIVVLSVFNGFFDVIKGLLLSYDPDIRIESAEGKSFLYQDSMRAELESVPEIRAISPYVQGKVLMAHHRRRENVITVKGVNRDQLLQLNPIEEHITSGRFDLSVQNRMPGLVLPDQQMAQMSLGVGDQVVLLSTEGMKKSLTQFTVPRSYRFQIRGGYSLRQVAGESVAYIDLQAASRLFDFRNTISGIDIRLTRNEQAEQVKEQLQGRFADRYRISTWYDLQKPLYDVMYLEKWGSYVILMIIVLVAVLNIVGSLTMIVIQKNRDIGVLRTMGYTPADIRSIFIKQGFYIGLIGCGLGGTLGLLMSWLQQEYGLIRLSSAFIIEAYPASISFVDVSIILTGSLLLCLGASWYPALRAAAVEPADAVRYE